MEMVVSCIYLPSYIEYVNLNRPVYVLSWADIEACSVAF